MDINTLYQVTDVQLYPSGEEVLNVYFYVNTGADGDAEDLTLAFNNDVVSQAQNFQSQDFVHTFIEAHSLGNPADFYTRALVDADGDQTYDALPAFTAVNFTLRLATRAVRPGSKRIAGLPDNGAVYSNGQVADAAMVTLLDAYATALGSDINAAGPLYTPVIVKRIREGAPGSYTYRLPTTSVEAEYYAVAAVLWNTRLSHQVSRGNQR